MQLSAPWPATRSPAESQEAPEPQPSSAGAAPRALAPEVGARACCRGPFWAAGGGGTGQSRVPRRRRAAAQALGHVLVCRNGSVFLCQRSSQLRRGCSQHPHLLFPHPLSQALLHKEAIILCPHEPLPEPAQDTCARYGNATDFPYSALPRDVKNVRDSLFQMLQTWLALKQ